VGTTLSSLAEFAILLGGSFVLLRHAGLAALAAIAPLPGYIIAYWLFAPPLPVILAAYLLSNILAARIALGVADGEAPPVAVRSVVTGLALPNLCALALSAAGLFAVAIDRYSWSFLTAILASGLSAMVAVPLAARWMSLDEEFIARTNRVRESRQRVIDVLAAVTRPRWGWSVAGIAIVFDALGFFGAHLAISALPRSAAITIAAVLMGLIVFALAVMRDWRRGLALIFAVAPVVLFLCWMIVATQSYSRLSFLLLGMGAGATLLMSASAAAFVRQDADMAAASRRSLALNGPAVAVAMAVAALVPPIFGQGLPSLIALFGGAAALLFEPGYAAAIESLAPRRATIEARYRVR
jgi:hypothetical protein